jgi:hypothetical protein
MARRNNYPGNCVTCGVPVAPQKGYIERNDSGKWDTKCEPCSGVAANAKPIIDVTPFDGGCARIAIKPRDFLGGDLFAIYQAACEGAAYVASSKCQVAPIATAGTILRNLAKVDGIVVQIAPEVAAALQAYNAATNAEVGAADERTVRVDAALRARGLTLFPFQKIGVPWLAARSCALLADDQGLGKTIQALTALPENAPVIVVAPAVAKGVWLRETAKWRPEIKITVLNGRGSFRLPAPGEMIVTNYEILTDEPGAIPEGLIVIADEAHLLKNKKTARAKRFRAISRPAVAKKGRVWLLTATPLLNQPGELWSLFETAGLERECFGSYNAFFRLFDGHRDDWGKVEWGTPDTAELSTRLRRVMLRRRKVDVLKELPAKQYRTIVVDIDDGTRAKLDTMAAELEAETGKSLTEIFEAIAEGEEGLAFQRMSAIRAALAQAKIPAVIDLAEEYEEQGEPLVVFSAHLAPIDALAKRKGWAKITGATSATKRTQIEDAFQRGELKGVACTIKAGGVAITLTRSANSIFLDKEWTPSLVLQAEDRIYRIGQSRGVLITTLVSDHPIDVRIAELNEKKARIIAASVDASSIGGEDVTTVELVDVDFDALAAEAAEEARLADEAKAAAAARAKEFEGRVIAPAPGSGVGTGGGGHRRPRSRKVDSIVAEEAWETQAAPVRRSAQTVQEEWAARGLEILTIQDTDRASILNGVGFNKADGSPGRALLAEIQTVGLTNKQWEYAVAFCRKYHGQIGRCPAVEASAAA